MTPRFVAVRTGMSMIAASAPLLFLHACGGSSVGPTSDASDVGNADAGPRNAVSEAAPLTGCSRGRPCPIATAIDANAVVRLEYQAGTFSYREGCDPLYPDTHERLTVDFSSGTARRQSCVELFNPDAGQIDRSAPVDVAPLRAALGRLKVLPVTQWNDGGSEGADGLRETLFIEGPAGVVQVLSHEHIGSPGPKLDLIAVEGFQGLRDAIYEQAP